MGMILDIGFQKLAGETLKAGTDWTNSLPSEVDHVYRFFSYKLLSLPL